MPQDAKTRYFSPHSLSLFGLLCEYFASNASNVLDKACRAFRIILEHSSSFLSMDMFRGSRSSQMDDPISTIYHSSRSLLRITFNLYNDVLQRLRYV
jgi:hypothetical protein